MNKDAIQLTRAGLATYRISHFVVEDELFEPIRSKIWKRYPPESTKIGYLFTCYWCSSIYAASALEISRMIAPKTTRAVESVLAASAVAGIVAARLEK